MLWKNINLKNRHLDKITLENIELKMNKEKFDKNFIEDILSVFNDRINKSGKEEFQKWITNLHFKVPEEFQNEQTSIKMYKKHHQWIEEEVIKLEKETKLPWEIQAEDLKNIDLKARKAQLVIRHRLTEIVLDLID